MFSVGRIKMKKLIPVILILSLIACADFSDDQSSSSEVHSRQKRKVLTFPQNAVMQLTMCIISQISFIPSHKVAANVGFNVNYALPYTLRSVYNPVFWARELTGESNPIMTFFDKFIESESERAANSTRRIDQTTETPTTVETTDENEDTTTESTDDDDEEERAMRKKRDESEAKGDLTAAEFFLGVKETLIYSGYHESCLLKSVCELAKHPIHMDDEHNGDNLIMEIIHLVLTPSAHQSFDPVNELDEKREFEEAEDFGKSDGDCELKYGSECTKSPLETISHFIHDHHM